MKDYNRPEIYNFYAIVLQDVDRFEDTSLVLKQLQSGKSVYNSKATLYLALSSLKQQKYEDCKSILNQIPEDSDDYDKSQKLLKDLK